MEYALVDSGYGQKLERFGEFLLIRPCAQAIWSPTLPQERWEEAHAYFEREEGNHWVERVPLPPEWNTSVEGIQFKLKRTDFGHVGIFPEHASQWKWMSHLIKQRPSARILNLFAYSGGATLAAAKAGASVCHLDAAKGMVSWARENAALNFMDDAPIRWIVDDVRKFISREIRRNERYDGIILDPPSFGRGKSGEVFKIENDLPTILSQCVELLSDEPLFLLFSCHTPGYTPIVMRQFLSEFLKGGSIEAGEMVLTPATRNSSLNLVPSGTYARWTHEIDSTK